MILPWIISYRYLLNNSNQRGTPITGTDVSICPLIPLVVFIYTGVHKWPLSRLFGLKRLTPSIKEVLLEERCAFQRAKKEVSLV